MSDEDTTNLMTVIESVLNDWINGETNCSRPKLDAREQPRNALSFLQNNGFHHSARYSSSTGPGRTRSFDIDSRALRAVRRSAALENRSKKAREKSSLSRSPTRVSPPSPLSRHPC